MANKTIQLSDGTNNLYPIVSQEYSTTTIENSTYGNFEAIKIGNLVYAHPSTMLTNIPTSWQTIGTLPEKFRPIQTIPYATLVCQTDSSIVLLVGIFASGNINVRAFKNNTSGWFNDYVLFPVAS